MNRIAFISLSIALFLLFRYLRANRTILLFFFSLFFIILAIYESKTNILLIFILSIIALASSYLALLKEKRHPFIVKIQKGYKPVEYIAHAIFFVVIIFLLLLIIYK